ncbi:MAG: tetratricopeptide repeat protein [Pseudomonadota bacterium]|nr:tetratricopeptide repeat protein [Pseudomonadota bacterium]
MSRRKRNQNKNPDASNINQALMVKAVDLHGTGDLDGAEEIYLEILNKDPGNPIALHYHGVLQFQRGKHGEAKALISKALEIAPDYADAHYNLGKVHHESDEIDTAISYYETAISYDSESPETYNRLGLAQEQKGLLSAAEKSYETALEQQPEFLDALNNLGNVLRSLERPEDAIKQFLRAIEINSNFMEAHHNLGNAYQDLSLFEKATDSYLMALSINPDFTESQKNLGTCLLGCGQYREGLNYLRKSCGVIEFTLGEYPQYQLAR